MKGSVLRSYRWTASELSSSEDLDAHPGYDAPTPTANGLRCTNRFLQPEKGGAGG